MRLMVTKHCSMPRKLAMKYLLDLEQLISELEKVVVFCNRDFFQFNENFMALRTVERNLERMGEANRQLHLCTFEIKIAHAKDIIGLRNMLAHAYDSIDATVLWKILLRDIPDLTAEVLLHIGQTK